MCQVPQGSLCQAFQRKLQPLSSTAEKSVANMEGPLISSLTIAPKSFSWLVAITKLSFPELQSSNLFIASLKRCQQAAYRPSPILLAFVKEGSENLETSIARLVLQLQTLAPGPVGRR